MKEKQNFDIRSLVWHFILSLFCSILMAFVLHINYNKEKIIFIMQSININLNINYIVIATGYFISLFLCNFLVNYYRKINRNRIWSISIFFKFKDFFNSDCKEQPKAWMIGMVERFFITTIAFYDVKSAVTFSIAWIGLKLATGWNKHNYTSRKNPKNLILPFINDKKAKFDICQMDDEIIIDLLVEIDGRLSIIALSTGAISSFLAIVIGVLISILLSHKCYNYFL